MISNQIYKRIFRISALYDLLVSWPFATPVTLTLVWEYAMSSLHRELGFGELPVLGVYAVLFANFFGTVVVIWSIVRLVSDDPRLGIHDGIARLAFSTWMIVALFSGATPLIWFFLVPEITFGVLQLTGLTKSLNRAWQA